jgi:penicillin G amidase
MRRLVKVVGVLGILLLTLVGVARFWLQSTVPRLGGRDRLPGLGDSVVVLLDSLAVPHIIASRDSDLFAALGYLHARDRLWQMDLLRHAAEGRLSELFGARTVSTDRRFRDLELARLATARLAAVGPATRAALEAYARGVNAWIVRGERSLEHRLVGHRAEPWRPEHSVVIGLLQNWDLRSQGDEIALARAIAELGAERAKAFLAPYDTANPTIISSAGSGLTFESGRTAAASNAWAVSGSRTASGKPILANDPHLALRAPSIWYLAGLHGPTYEVVGVTIPGLPVVVLGHNRHVAWGFTNGMVDDLDYVLEELSPDSLRYRTATGWADIEAVAETILVSGGEPVVFTRRRTVHGPLVDTAPGGRALLAMRWTAQDASDELQALLSIGRARNRAEFLAGAAQFLAPQQNIVYADTAGTIGYVLAGRVPVRRSGDGTLATPGWTDEGRWIRYLSLAERPQAWNPPAGYIVTANNRIVGDRYPFFISSDWDPGYRAFRIRELVRADSFATVTSTMRHQRDILDPFARRHRGLAAAAASTVGREDVAARLRQWDGTMAADRVEPTLFWTWYQALRRLTYEDESPDFQPGAPVRDGLARGESPWFDDRRTPEREGLAALSVLAMREALAQVDGVPWGSVHQAVVEHPLAGVPVLGRILGFAIGPWSSGGDNHTVNVSISNAKVPPFNTSYGPSMRHVVDLADPDGQGGFIIPGGQSGHPLSPHYRDQFQLWLRGELWVVPVDVGRVRVKNTLVLEPG